MKETTEGVLQAWHVMPIGGKASLIVLIITLPGVGWGIRSAFFENRELAAIRIEHANDMGKIQREMDHYKAEAQTTKAKLDYAERFIQENRPQSVVAVPLNTIPELESAQFDETTAEELARRWFQHRGKYTSMTTIQQPNFYEQYAGRKFQWEGLLVDVMAERSETCAVLEVITSLTTPDDSDTIEGHRVQKLLYRPIPFQFRCYFANNEYQQQLRAFRPRYHTLTVIGVMDSSGNLRRCRIENVQDRIYTPTFRFDIPSEDDDRDRFIPRATLRND